MANFGTAYINVAGNFAPLEAEINGLASGPIGKKFTTVGKSLTRNLTLPIVGVGAAAAKLSGEFQRSMTLISTQAGGTKKEVKSLGDAILSGSQKGRFTQSANELAQGLFHIESTGARGKKAWKDLKATADLATIGNANYEATTNAVVGVQKTQIKGTENLRKEIGLLNAGIGVGNLRMEDLNSAVGTGFVGSSKALGLSLQDDLAALGELTSQSVPANAAATRLRMTFNLLANPTTKAQGVLKEIGIGSEDLAKKMQEPNGIVRALELLKDHMQGFSRIERNQLLSAAFGGAKSGGTLLQLIENVGDLNKKYVELGKNAGNVKKDLEETNKDPEVKLQKAWRRIEATLIQLGSHILPIVVPMFEKIAGFVDKIGEKFAGLSPSSKKLVVEIGFIAAALGPVLLLGGKLLKLFSGSAKAAQTMARWLGIASTEQAAGGVAGTGRAGGIIGGLATGAGAAGGPRWLGTETLAQRAALENAGRPVTAASVGAFGEKQALRDAGLLGGGAGARSIIGAPGGLSTLGKVVLPIAVVIGEIQAGKVEKKVGGGSTPAKIIEDILNPVTAVASDIPHRFEGAFGLSDKKKLGTVTNDISGPFKATMTALRLDQLAGLHKLNIDLTQGLEQTGQEWHKGTRPWREQTVEAMRETVHSIQEGMKNGSIKAKEGKAEIKQLLGEIKIVEGSDPLGLAKGVMSSFKKAGGITQSGINGLIKDFQTMPKGAREAAQDAVIGMARKWAQGHPKIESQVDVLSQNLEHKFGKTNHQIFSGVSNAVSGIGELFNNLSGTVSEALKSLGLNVNSILKALGISKAVNFSVHAVTGAAAGVVNAGKGVVEAITGKQTGGFIVPGRGDGDSFPTMLPPGSFVLNKKATAAYGFQDGGHVPVMLEPEERVFYPEAVSQVGLHNLEAANNRVRRFATGGQVVEPVIGGAEPLRSVGQGAVHKVTQAARKFVNAHRPKGLGSMSASGSVASHPELQAGISAIVATILKRFPALQITSTTGGTHATNSLHYQGRAADLAADSGYMLKAAAWIKANLGASLTEGIHNPNLSIKYGKDVPSSYWGEPTWAEHLNHIHVGKQRGGLIQVLAGGGIPKEGGKFKNALSDIWHRVAPFYGRSRGSQHPTTFLSRGVKERGSYGSTVRLKDGHKVVLLQPGSAHDIVQRDGDGMRTLLHEWTHVFQDKREHMKLWESEGGASALAEKIGYSLYGSGPWVPPNAKYRDYMGQVFKQKGWGWVDRGQFNARLTAPGYVKGGLVQALAGGGSVKGPWAGTSIDKTYPQSNGISTGATLPKYVIEALAEWGGLPGITMGQITEGESTGHPGMDIPDPPGRSRGLYAINDYYNPQFGATAMRNPILNTLAAKRIVGSGLPNAGIWHGSSHVTGWDLHYNGDPAAIATHLGGSESAGSGSGSTPIPKQQTGSFTKHKAGETSAAGGTYGQNVKGHYKAQTAKLSFGSVPNSLEECTKELRRLQERVLPEYKAAFKDEKDAETKKAIGVNVKLIEQRIAVLRKARIRLARQERLKKSLAKITEAAEFGKWTAPNVGIFARREAAYELASELAEQAVTLEPEEPANVTGDWVSSILKPYVEGTESPAYGRVLGAEADWRNAFIEAEGEAQGRIAHWGERIGSLKERIAEIYGYKSSKPRAWAKQKDLIPDLKAQIKGLVADISKTRTETLPEWEKSLGGVQGLSRTHEILASLPGDPTGQFGGSIFDTQETIRGLGLKVPQALASLSGSDSGKGEREALLEQLLTEANQRNLLRGIEERVFGAMPKPGGLQRGGLTFAGPFHEGGVVPGPPTQDVLSLTRGGEAVFTEDQRDWLGVGAPIAAPASPGDIKVHVHGDIVSSHPDPVEVLVNDRRFPAEVRKITGHDQRRGVRGAGRGLAKPGVFGR